MRVAIAQLNFKIGAFRPNFEKIRQAIEAYEFPFGDKQPLNRLTISGGVACFPQDGRNSSELIRAADQALYQAKGNGRNSVQQG